MRFEKVKCNLCGTDDTMQMGKRKAPGGDGRLQTNIVRCRGCGLMYPNPMPRFDHEEIQKNFSNGDNYFSGGINESHIKKYDNFMRMVESYKPEKGDILDVGCGRGELVFAAKSRGWRVIGTEISGDFGRYAREHFGVDILSGDIEEIDFTERRFDVICLNSVIQYVWDPAGTLKKINGLLKEDGILYIEVTNDDALVFKIGDMFQSLVNRKKITTRLSPLFPSFQIYGFSKRSLTKALSGSGFEVCRMEIKGARGGGTFEGSAVLKMVRKIIIFVGGLTGNGHLIQCVAKKRRIE